MKESTLNNNEKDINWLYSVVFTILSLGCIFYLRKMLPGGEYRMLSDDDLYMQYATFGSMMAQKIKEGSYFYYTFNSGMGTNLALFAGFYIMSPFNIFYLLIKDITLATFIIVVAKACVAAAFFQIFCKKSLKISNMYTVIFSVCYAVGSFYFYVFHMNIIYDAVYFLPLILLLLDTMIQKNNPVPFAIGLSVLFITNIYGAFTVGVSSFVFFLMKIYGKEERKKHIIHFFMSFVIALCVSLAIILPAIYVVIKSDKNSMEHLYELPSFISVVRALFPWNERVLFESTPSLYCGTISVVFAFLYLLSKKLSMKKRLFIIGGFVFFLVSLYIPWLNKALHMFNYPDGYMCRYAYIISFAICIMAALQSATLFENNTVKKHIITACLGLYCMFEIISNGYFMTKSYELDNQNYFYNAEQEIEQALDAIKVDNDIYRIQMNNHININASALYDYYSTVTYSSADSNSMREIMRKLGYAFFDNGIREFGSMDLTRLLFGEKYVLSVSSENNPGTAYIYQFPEYLALGFMTSDSIKNVSQLSEDVFDNLNQVVYGMSNIDNIMIEKNYFSIIPDNVDCIPNEDGSLYYKSLIDNGEASKVSFLIDKEDYDKAFCHFTSYYDSYVSGRTPMLYSSKDFVNYKNFVSRISDPHIVEMYENDDSFCVDLIFNGLTDDEAEFPMQNFAYLDSNKFNQLYDYLKANQFNFEIFEDGHIVGNVEATNEKTMLFFSIPYEDGWNVWVDGNKQEIVPLVENGFIGVELAPGLHQVELKFTAPLSNVGILFTCIGLVLLLTMCVYYSRIKKDKTKE